MSSFGWLYSERVASTSRAAASAWSSVRQIFTPVTPALRAGFTTSGSVPYARAHSSAASTDVLWKWAGARRPASESARSSHICRAARPRRERIARRHVEPFGERVGQFERRVEAVQHRADPQVAQLRERRVDIAVMLDRGI